MSHDDKLSHPPSRLIAEFDNYDEESLTDHLLLLAKDIENALLQAGAVPNKDYSYIQIFELAVKYRSLN